MFKYNVGDTVFYKGKKEYIVGRMYIEKGNDVTIAYKLSLEHKNIKEDELKESAKYSIEIKDRYGDLIQKIDCDKMLGLSGVSELSCTFDEMYVNGEKVDYLIGVKF